MNDEAVGHSGRPLFFGGGGQIVSVPLGKMGIFGYFPVHCF